MKNLTLPLSITGLVEAIGTKKNFSPREITSMIRNANIKVEDINEWADFEHHKIEGYGRKMVYEGEHFEIMVMSWAPGDATAIHNHGYTEWGAVQAFGKLEHSTFELEAQTLSTLFRQKLTKGEIIPVDQSLIHQMGNPYLENTLSLHVYGTSNEVDGVTSNSHIYEVGKGEVQLVDGGVFYDLPDAEVGISDANLFADRLTMIGHFTQLLNYYHKTGTKGPQYQKAVNYFHDRSFESRLITELEMDSMCILYMIELKKAKKILKLLNESSRTIDAILREINDPDSFS